MARPKREYSREFAAVTGGSFSMHKIPMQLLIDVKAKAKREGVSLRAMLLRRMAKYLKETPKVEKGARAVK